MQKLEQENIALKEQVETLRQICGNRAEVPKNCEYCSNFIQHYIKAGNPYYPACDGHCVTGLRAGRQGIHARLLQKGHMGKITYKWGIWLKARKGGDGLGEKRK